MAEIRHNDFFPIIAWGSVGQRRKRYDTLFYIVVFYFKDFMD